MGSIKAAIRGVEEALAKKAEADRIAKEKAAAEKVVNDKAAAPIGSTSSSYSDKGSLTRYTPVTEKEIEIKSNLAGFKKGGLVVRGQGAVIRKKKTARIC
jgi:hypothetical protein